MRSFETSNKIITFHNSTGFDSSTNFYYLYTLNYDGRIIEQKSFSSDSSFTGGSKYEYNRAGKMIRVNTINKDGVTTNSLELIYDLNNNPVEMISWSNGIVHSRSIYEYERYYK